MNTVLGQISAFSGLPDDEQARAGAGPSFWEWREAAEPDCQGPDGYSPRGTYGRYLRYVLDAIEAGLPDGVTLRRVRDRVLELVPTDGRYRLRFAGRPSVDVDRVVLTTGHSTPEPTGTAKEWADFAAVRTGLRYIAGDSAADMPLGEVKPGTAVGVLGLGLSFFDVVAAFTTGRGGQFDETGDGSLRYLLSGDEPSLVAGSLNGVPLPARGRNQKPPTYSYRPVLFRPEHVAPRAGGLDFRADVLPWMLAEIDLVHCGTELEARFGPDVRAAFVDEVRGRAFSSSRPVVPGVRAAAARFGPLPAPADLDSLARPFAGRAFASPFDGNTETHLRGNIQTMLRMSAVLGYHGGIPVVHLGQIAGQYAKPRSGDTDALGLPSYRGDAVNVFEPTSDGRVPNPDRMVRAHANACATMNMLRAVVGTSSMRGAHQGYEEFLASARAGGRYNAMAAEIDRGLAFMNAFGFSGDLARAPEFFAGHEALLLDYDSALVRASKSGRAYGTSGHFLWLGERTRHLNGAHIAFAEHLSNPIGVKLGPTTSPEQALDYVERLDPRHEPGRLTLIARMGNGRVREALPPIVERVVASGHKVVWPCDPMHGNTQNSGSGHKIRHFDRIVDEVQGFFEVHRKLGTHPGGVHLELTGDDVTEGLGGAQQIPEADLTRRYETACDPRLNAQQSVELAFLIAETLRS